MSAANDVRGAVYIEPTRTVGEPPTVTHGRYLFIWASNVPRPWVPSDILRAALPSDVAKACEPVVERAFELGLSPVVVLDSAVCESVVNALRVSVGRVPVVVLASSPRSPRFVTADAVWLGEPPANDRAWQELVSALDQLEDARRGKTSVAEESFCTRYALGAREARLLRLTLEGFSSEQACAALRCGPSALESEWEGMAEKLGVSDKSEVLAAFVRHVLSL